MTRILTLSVITVIILASAYARARRTDPEYHRMYSNPYGAMIND